MNLRRDNRFLRCLEGRSDAELAEVLEAVQTAAAAFGRPHRHAGIGLRVLKFGFFECRAGLQLRLVFAREGDFVFTFAGNHDEVRAFLKGRPRRRSGAANPNAK